VRAEAPFEVAFTHEPHQLVASLHGELDAATRDYYAARLRDVLEGPERMIVVDAAELRFIDSAGIAAVVRTSVAASDQGKEFRVARAPRNIRRVFEITGLAYLLGD
jgi:anti-sigma B factor antagonist